MTYHPHRDQRGSMISQSSESPETSIILPPPPRSSDEKPSPGVLRAIQLLKDCHQLVLERDWNAIRLQPDEYDELWWRLEEDEEELLGYIEDKIRVGGKKSLDYDPGISEFVIRKPTAVHEHLLASIRSDIFVQLDTIRKCNSSAATIARKIRPFGSADLHLEDGAKRSPDMQFGDDGAKYPGLIIEVANAQQSKKDGGGKELSKLADQYIVESSGNVRTVVGISLDYGATKKATLSVWHPKYGVDEQGKYLAAEETIISQEFRTGHGNRVPDDKKLQITLEDFVPGDLLSSACPSEASEREIVIPYEKLAEYLDMADARDQLSRARQGFQMVMPAGMRKRRRESNSTRDVRLGRRAQVSTGRVGGREG